MSTSRDDTPKPSQVSHGPLMGQLLLPEPAQEQGVLLPFHHVIDPVIIQPHFVYREKHLTQDYGRLAAVHLNKCSMCSLFFFAPDADTLLWWYSVTVRPRQFANLGQGSVPYFRWNSPKGPLHWWWSQAVSQSITSRSGWNRLLTLAERGSVLPPPVNLQNVCKRKKQKIYFLS